MAANPVIIATRDREASTFTPGQAYPSVQVVALSDGLGNLLKATDNGDGTATLDTGGSGGGSGSSAPAASTTSFSADAVISATPPVYRGVTVRETTGTTTARVLIYDHASAASGTVREAINRNAGESVREYYPDGITASNGIYVDVVSGSVAGGVRTSTPGGGGTVATATAVTGSGVVLASAGTYRGFTLRETSGTAGAVVRIYDNASAASGTLLDEIALNPSESAREWYESGIAAVNGVYVKIVSGAVAGSVRLG